MNRTDAHSPTNLVTEDYDFGYCYDSHPEEGNSRTAMLMLDNLIDAGYRFGRVHGGETCDHCGARLRYVAVLKHEPTKTLIKVGETCLDNRFSLASDEFHRLRKAAALNRDRMKRSDKLAKWLDADPKNREAFEYAEAKVQEGDYGYNGMLHDFVHKSNRYGDCSEKFVDAVLRSKVREAEFAAKKAEDAKAASPVIAGKIQIVGEVLTTKWQENGFGGALKMLVKDDRGFKVWGTVPRSLDNLPGESGEEWDTRSVRKGDRIAFTATVAASDDDPTFGFFSRPTKAGLVAG